MTALDQLKPHAHWLLRLGLASVFLFHGIGKWTNLSGTADMMGGMPMAVLAALLETAGGLLVVAGAFQGDLLTRLGGLLIAPVMLGAIAMVHWPRWAFTPTDSHPMGGMEFQVVLLLVALYLVIVGNASFEQTAPANARAATAS